MKPEPVPRGTVMTLRVQKSTTRSRVEMNTTDDLELSKMSMVVFSSAPSSPRATTGRGVALALAKRTEISGAKYQLARAIRVMSRIQRVSERGLEWGCCMSVTEG